MIYLRDILMRYDSGNTSGYKMGDGYVSFQPLGTGYVISYYMDYKDLFRRCVRQFGGSYPICLIDKEETVYLFSNLPASKIDTTGVDRDRFVQDVVGIYSGFINKRIKAYIQDQITKLKFSPEDIQKCAWDIALSIKDGKPMSEIERLDCQIQNITDMADVASIILEAENCESVVKRATKDMSLVYSDAVRLKVLQEQLYKQFLEKNEGTDQNTGFLTLFTNLRDKKSVRVCFKRGACEYVGNINAYALRQAIREPGKYTLHYGFTRQARNGYYNLMGCLPEIDDLQYVEYRGKKLWERTA